MALLGRKAEKERPTVAPSPTPERSALAAALAEALAAKRARDGALAAEGPANAAVKAAREKVEDAEAAIEAAKAEAGRRAAASFATGDVLEAPTALRSARAALVEAEDDLAVAIAARDGLNARQSSDASAVADSDRKLHDAVAAVIRSEVAPSPEALGAEIIELQKQLANKVGAMSWLIDNAGALRRVREHGYYFGKPADEAVRAALLRMGTGNILLQGMRWEDMIEASPNVATLKAAAAALAQDAAAPVPSI